jgi:hypothetical protein
LADATPVFPARQLFSSESENGGQWHNPFRIFFIRSRPPGIAACHRPTPGGLIPTPGDLAGDLFHRFFTLFLPRSGTAVSFCETAGHCYTVKSRNSSLVLHKIILGRRIITSGCSAAIVRWNNPTVFGWQHFAA